MTAIRKFKEHIRGIITKEQIYICDCEADADVKDDSRCNLADEKVIRA